MTTITESQRAEAKRLLKTGLNSKEVAKKLKGVKTMQVAGIFAGMTKKSNNRKSAPAKSNTNATRRTSTPTPTPNWNGKALLGNFVASIPANKMNSRVKEAVRNLYSAIA